LFAVFLDDDFEAVETSSSSITVAKLSTMDETEEQIEANQPQGGPSILI
jgi:hypothetical protein